MSETADGEVVSTTHDPRPPHRPHAHNGTHARPVQKPAEEAEAPDDAYARAEAALDEMGDKVGKYVARLGKALTRFGMRAREEAEDIVVEAASLKKQWSERPE